MKENTNKSAAPHWLCAETVSRGRAELEREWVTLLREQPESDDLARLSHAMMALRAERPARPLLAPSNARALRWFDRKLRESRAAARLRRARPDLPLLSRVQLRWLALTGPVLSCCLMVLVQTKLIVAMDRVKQVGERVAAIHVERHIDDTTV